MLLPLGSPLPDDAVVSAVRGESGMLGGLSVPLIWGVAVPPDDYDHWAPTPEDGTETGVETTDSASSVTVTDGEWNGWASDAEPRFDVPRIVSVVPHSPAAG
jgi:hypothetical protein